MMKVSMTALGIGRSNAGRRTGQFVPVQTQFVDDFAHDSGVEPLAGTDIGKNRAAISEPDSHICMSLRSDRVLASIEGATTL